MMDRAEIRETLDKADELVTELKAFRNLSPESGNATSVSISAGGVGVWIAVTACMVMALLAVIMAIMFVDLNRKYDRMQDYQNTTYMLVPEFRKLVDQELEKRKQEKN